MGNIDQSSNSARRRRLAKTIGVSLAAGLVAAACVSTTPSDSGSGFPAFRRRTVTTTTVKPTTTVAPTTTATPNTTVAPATTAAPTTTVAPTTTQAPAPTTAPTAVPTGSGSCTFLRQLATTSPRKYSANTTWNLPASCFTTAPDSARWAANWFNNSHRGAYLGDTTKRGQMSLGLSEYSNPIYDAAQATYRVRVFTSTYGHNLGADISIPWNPTWEPSAGNDHEMIIVDKATGREWGLWLVQKTNYSSCFTWANLLAGYQAGTDLCVGQILVGRNPDGSYSDYRTDSGMSQWAARGMGAINPLALLPTLDEVESGAIHHALNNEVYNPSFGAACTPSQMGTADAGITCGYAVAPATRFERLDGPAPECGASAMANTATDRAKTVPEGTRFVVDLTDAEIDAWLTSRGYTGAKRSTARVFAVALRDYGWVVSDTTCWDSTVSVEGVANPTAAQRWANLGLSASDGQTLLVGLIRGDRIRTLTPPSALKFTNLA